MTMVVVALQNKTLHSARIFFTKNETSSKLKLTVTHHLRTSRDVIYNARYTLCY